MRMFGEDTTGSGGGGGELPPRASSYNDANGRNNGRRNSQLVKTKNTTVRRVSSYSSMDEALMLSLSRYHRQKGREQRDHSNKSDAMSNDSFNITNNNGSSRKMIQR